MNDAKTPPMSNESAGNFFEDFKLGQEIVHATPRTVTVGDVSLFTALYGSRFAVQSSDAFAQSIGYPTAPIDDMLTFHIVLGKTVPDISRNAIANLGYADMRFLKPVYPGDTLSTTTEIIGLKENSNRKNGTVYVRSTGRNQRAEPVLSFSRWVMVNKRDESAPAPEPHVPELIAEVEPSRLGDALPSLKLAPMIMRSPGRPSAGATTKSATRSIMSTARPSRRPSISSPRGCSRTRPGCISISTSSRKAEFKRRIVYGGHVISIARALSFNGLANAFHLAAINGGRHVAPSFAGDTIYAWSEVTDKAELPGRADMGALRLRLFAVKDRNCTDFPGQKADGRYEDGVVLDLDCWVALPR